ncbi:hypothetical protein Cgig2_023031 [Carnegiea gigantea]|uniref:Wound-induced protein 1 n=1 Tax=Carnegiea gigantea TaxID=171969 RepID=A0A9Q1QEI9_9CARY|nr:hypothetical protein Cgig2_023031 [Carnegiea gigantea]
METQPKKKREERERRNRAMGAAEREMVNVTNEGGFQLANPSAPSNEVVVKALYEALSSRDAHAVQSLLAPDLEWWFHGPPSHQFLMRILTGATTSNSNTFQFNPQSIVAFGSLVLAEGCDPDRSISWVHAWTLSPDGIITQVREYFNTSVTVTRLGKSQPSDQIAPANLHHCQPLWESTLANRAGKSVPGLVLAL